MAASRGGEDRRTWSVIERTRRGRPEVATINTAYQHFTDPASFPWFLLVSIPLERPRADGLCDAAENGALERLQEDVVLPAVERTCRSHFIGRTTHDGLRELAFQVDDPFRVVEALDEIETAGTRRFTFGAERDDDWQHVRDRLLNVSAPRARWRWPFLSR